MRRVGRILGNVAAGVGIVTLGGMWLILGAAFLVFVLAMILLIGGAVF